MGSIQSKGAAKYVNFNTVEVCQYYEANFSSRIISALKVARKQSPSGYPSLVYVNIQELDPWKLIDIIDTSYDTVFKALNSNTKRINGLVVSGRALQQHPERPIDYQYKFIPNYNASCQILASINPVGIRNNGRELCHKQGTIVLEPDTSVKLHTGTSCAIFEHSSHDGKFQFRLCKTWRETLRMELVEEEYGRRMIESESISFPGTLPNKIVGRWAKNMIGISIRLAQDQAFKHWESNYD